MEISGVGSYNYANYYQNNVSRHSEQASSTFSTSASVFKADNYTEENPEYLVKYWDEKGEIQEYTVNPKEADPLNASYIEMLAYSTYSDVQGYTLDAYENFMSAAGGTSADLTYDSSNVHEKKNFKSMVQDFMQMQYDAETGVTWYLNDERGPYMSGEDSEKFDKWCEDNGVNKLKKFAEMTGLIRIYSDGITAYVGDNGIAERQSFIIIYR